MTPHQTVAVAARVFAIWMCVKSLPIVLQYHALREVDPSGWPVLLAVLVVIGGIAMGLWFFPMRVARTILPPVDPDARDAAAPQTSIRADTWLAMGCSLIGLWMMVSTLPGLFGHLVDLFRAPDSYGFLGGDLGRVPMLYSLTQVALAAWLILGARGFRRLFWWARRAGLARSE